MTTILVGTDSVGAADLALHDAARLARDRGTELLVLPVRPRSDTIVIGNRGTQGSWWSA